MKLYDLQRGDKFRVIGDLQTPPDSLGLTTEDTYVFRNVDGMYSYCYLDDNTKQVVHPVAWTEVEKVLDKTEKV